MTPTVIFILYTVTADAGWDQRLNMQVHPDNCVTYQRQAVQNAKDSKESVIAICERYVEETMRTDRVIQLSGEVAPFPEIPMLHYNPEETALCTTAQPANHCENEFAK